MKKTIIILSALLLGLVSCTEPLLDAPNIQKPEETGMVAVTMELTIPNVEIQALTKANTRSHDPQIDYIRVAVFGTSGFPQAYNLAEPVEVDDQGNVVRVLDHYATTNGDTYHFRVLLPIYEGEAHVHIIANGDESIPYVDENSVDMTEESIMSAMFTENNVGAFWTSVILPDGILPVINEYGIYQTDGNTGNFVPSQETADAFKNLMLVRNFAEVTLTIGGDVNNFSDISWTLVNVPKKGSVVPMWGDASFVFDYQDYVYDTATGRMKKDTKTYEGYTFDDDPMDFTVPADAALPCGVPGDPELGNKPTSAFLYERVLPTDHATCILMRGKFGTDDYYTYYRLDLTQEDLGGYFPIYRNYQYQMKVRKVNNRGAKTPGEAMNRDSGGNVSQSIEAKKLTDISDGTSRLYVEYVEKNFTSGGTKSLWVYYKPDVVNYPDEVDNSSIEVTIKTQGDALVEGTDITLTSASSTSGVYFYEFELNDQDEETDRVSVLTITAHNGKTGDDKSTLYRDITLRVMHKMDMTLNLVPKTVSGVGTNTVLKIGLPDGLPSSMFPLEIHIEDVNHTLNPTQTDGNGNDLIIPVKTATSLADGTTNSFYFIRTVNESEYLANHTISTEFKTLNAASATTIYVANEYFKTQSINLLNDGIYVNPTNLSVAFNVTEVEIEVESEDQTKTWTVTAGTGVMLALTNPVSGNVTLSNNVVSGTGNGKFKMTFNANNSTTAYAKRTATVTSSDGDRVITITQSPLEFTASPNSQTVKWNATSANVTVYAPEGKHWEATVTGQGNPTLSDDEGTGTRTITVNFSEQTSSSFNARNFIVTFTMTDPSGTATATVVQRGYPRGQVDFASSDITISNNAATTTSTDGYITLSFANISRPDYSNAIRMSNGSTQGSFTVTPNEGVKITSIVITYSSEQTSENNPTLSPETTVGGSYQLTSSGSWWAGYTYTGTWTLPSSWSSPATITFSTFGNNTGKRITNIQVNYEP